MSGQPDPRPPARVRDPGLMRRLHQEWRECAICGTQRGRLSLHHVRNKPRHDTRDNLIMLCGDGVAGCHGRVTANDPVALRLLAEALAERATA